MGGIIILLSLFASVFLLCDLTNLYVQLLLVSTLWLSLIGFLDDLLKLRYKAGKEGGRLMRFLQHCSAKTADGMKGKLKIYGQVGLGLIVGLALFFSDRAVIVELGKIPKDVNDTEQVVVPEDIRPCKEHQNHHPFSQRQFV